VEAIVQIRGLSELARTLQQDLPDTMAKRCIRESLHAAGEVVAQAAEAAAPVGDAKDPHAGALKDDIGTVVRVDPGAMGGYALIGPLYNRSKLIARNGRTATTDSPGVYGMFVEVGHGPPGMAKEKRAAHRRGIELEFGGRETPPHPWLRPAWEASKGEALSALLGTLRETISESARQARSVT
jgi:hypothetical protein